MSLLKPETRIYIAGHCGMVGSVIVLQLQGRGCKSLITRTHVALDLTNQQAVHDFLPPKSRTW